ncbi:MAG: RidA family protein [Sporichthyaceae bacterium]
MSVADRLIEAGITVPELREPAGLYRPAVQAGELLYLSGAGPALPNGRWVKGKVGADLDLEGANHAAWMAGLQLLAAMQAELGDLDRVVAVVKLFGMVNVAPGFNTIPAVIDGCSQVLIAALGEAGRGARTAVGVAELPFNIAVEVEAVVQVRD